MYDFAIKRNASASESLPSVDVRGQRTVQEEPREERSNDKPVQAVSKEQAEAIVQQIDSYLKSSRRELQFQVDDESGHVVVRVRDAATGDVIRQIPGEEALRVARALQENSAVLLDLVV